LLRTSNCMLLLDFYTTTPLQFTLYSIVIIVDITGIWNICTFPEYLFKQEQGKGLSLKHSSVLS
jgi:hypothetical protein